jgi:hypothetical protein
MRDHLNDRRDEQDPRDDPDFISEDGAAGAPMPGGGFPPPPLSKSMMRMVSSRRSRCGP